MLCTASQNHRTTLVSAVSSIILCGTFQLVEVEFLLSTDQHLQLSGTEEHVHRALAGHQVEPPLEGEELLFNTLVQEKVGVEVDIFSLVGLAHQDVSSVTLQFFSDGGPEKVFV